MEEVALKLGLLFRTLAPMGDRANIRAVVEGIEAMQYEEIAYWPGMAIHRKHPHRVLTALGNLLTDTRTRQAVPAPPPLTASLVHEVWAPPHTTFYAVQEREGCVSANTASVFVAGIVDRTAGSSHREEEAMIPLAQDLDGEASRQLLGGILGSLLLLASTPVGYPVRAVRGRIGYAGLPVRVPLASQAEQTDLPERRLGHIESTCHLGSAGDHRILSTTASKSM